VIFSKHSETYRGESESGHGESVENFDRKVALSIHDLAILSWCDRFQFSCKFVPRGFFSSVYEQSGYSALHLMGLLSTFGLLWKETARTAPSLGNLRELLDEFVFVDDEKMIGISINPRLRNLCMKKLIRGRVAYHLGQFFMEISVQCGWNKSRRWF
jgi:hypothetical protein